MFLLAGSIASGVAFVAIVGTFYGGDDFIINWNLALFAVLVLGIFLFNLYTNKRIKKQREIFKENKIIVLRNMSLAMKKKKKGRSPWEAMGGVGGAVREEKKKTPAAAADYTQRRMLLHTRVDFLSPRARCLSLDLDLTITESAPWN